MRAGRVPLEFDAYITPDGITYPLVDGAGRSLIVGISGQGMPDISYITQRGPYQHGSDVLDYRINERTLQFTLRHDGCDRADYWAIRDVLMNHLRPNRQTDPEAMTTGRLRKVLPDHTYRDIDVLVASGPDFRGHSPDQWDEWGIEEPIRLIAFDPTFYDPYPVTVFLGTAFTVSELIFPFVFPFLLGASGVVTSETTITYPGTWLSYPTIYILGPFDTPVIENLTTGEQIGLAYSIATGEQVTIDLRYGVKSVVSSVNGNITGVASEASDLATFHIAPDPEAAGGVNTLRVTGITADANTRVWLDYYVRYIGI